MEDVIAAVGERREDVGAGVEVDSLWFHAAIVTWLSSGLDKQA